MTPPTSHALLDCLTRYMRNRRTDVTEQLYCIAEMKNHQMERLRETLLTKAGPSATAVANIERDGLPSSAAVEQWLADHGKRYPEWGRTIGNRGALILPGILAGLIAFVMLLTGGGMGLLTLIAIIAIGLFISINLRVTGEAAHRRRLVDEDRRPA